MSYTIRPATSADIGQVSDIIRSSYRTVANTYHLTRENCPKHPSNCTEEWVEKDLARGVAYYLMESETGAIGCSGLEQADEETCYLERLAVVPASRRQGLGRRLAEHIIGEARARGCKKVGIGIIAKQLELRDWYLRLGFLQTGTRTFDHLPFEVAFLELLI